MRRLAEWYDYRIVNVNVNILLAGVIALAITVGVMHVLEITKWLSYISSWAEARVHLPWIGHKIETEKLVISGVTFIVDLVADVLVYYALHWLANHMPRRKPRVKDHAYADLTFMRDASLVQFERALLSPVLYVAALGLQSKLMHEGVGVGMATACGFAVGLILTRVLHTLWMLRAERRSGVKTAADVVGPDPHPRKVTPASKEVPQAKSPPAA